MVSSQFSLLHKAKSKALSICEQRQEFGEPYRSGLVSFLEPSQVTSPNIPLPFWLTVITAIWIQIYICDGSGHCAFLFLSSCSLSLLLLYSSSWFPSRPFAWRLTKLSILLKTRQSQSSTAQAPFSSMKSKRILP